MRLRLLFFVFLLGRTALAQVIRPEPDIPGAIEARTFDASLLLWYQQPAARWEDALPVGNGHIGAMIFGDTLHERLQLNEDTYWTGGPYSTVVKGGAQWLPAIQQLVREGKSMEAHTLFGRHLMGDPVYQQKYQPLANLWFDLPGAGATVTGYRRWLDLATGISGVQYTAGGVTYRREVFVSAPDQVMVVRFTADKPASLNVSVSLRGIRNETEPFQMNAEGADGLSVTGKSADYNGIEGRVRYRGQLRIVADNGVLSGNGVVKKVDHADTVTVYFSAATNFINYKDVSGNPDPIVRTRLQELEGKSYAVLRQRHCEDYSRYFNRVVLRLPVTEASYAPTDKRLQQNMDYSDPALAALAYQFARYVLISCSRPGSQPANLQGIWNQDLHPAWSSKYTTNINLQMNYWMVESANLTEMADPLFQLIRDVTDEGAKVAREHYGAGGWVLHQNTDIWRVAAPMDGPTWGTFTTGGAWLCTHLWEHFLYTRDTAWLRKVYPILKGSVTFFLDFLTLHPNGKWLVTNPSTSPENFPASPGNGSYFDETCGLQLRGTTICEGSAIDTEILTDLFGYFTEASSVLGEDADLASAVKAARTRLPPMQIGKDSSLQEWADDWGQLEKEHRHASHLYGLFPGHVIDPNTEASLAEACRKVLQQRGDGATGWSRAWKICLWARLGDGNHVNRILKLYFREQAYMQLFARCGNPMQVDGTLGTGAGISEMMVQSYGGVIRLLPAIPEEWDKGSMRGVRARGAFQLDLQWSKGKITQAVLLSEKGLPCTIQPNVQVRITCNGKPVAAKHLADGVLSFPTQAGRRYVLTAIASSTSSAAMPSALIADSGERFLQRHYTADWRLFHQCGVPDWFRDAKFGIFVTWCPYTVPEYQGWYSRRIYEKAQPSYQHHLDSYGEQTRVGYKDFIQSFGAELFDADKWKTGFRKRGVYYVVDAAEHYDGFAMYGSSLTRWNLAETGLHRDFVKDMQEVAHGRVLMYNVSSHCIDHWWYFLTYKKLPSDVNDSQFFADLYGTAMVGKDTITSLIHERLADAQCLICLYSVSFCQERTINKSV